MLRGLAIALGLLIVALGAGSCTLASSFNAFQRRDEQVSQTERQMLSVYQKRADLIPNLVETVKGYATHESATLTKVVEARAAASKITLPENATEADLQRFAAAQREVGSSLGRLLAVAEAYPDLKANQGFLGLQRDLRDIEAQAAAARNRYIREVAAYNVNIRSFPTNIVATVLNYRVKPQLQFDDEREIKRSPKVNFGGKS